MEVGKAFLAVVVMGLGVLGALFPHVPWYLTDGLRARGHVPSHVSLLLNRVGGAIVFLIGLWVLLAR